MSRNPIEELARKYGGDPVVAQQLVQSGVKIEHLRHALQAWNSFSLYATEQDQVMSEGDELLPLLVRAYDVLKNPKDLTQLATQAITFTRDGTYPSPAAAMGWIVEYGVVDGQLLRPDIFSA